MTVQRQAMRQAMAGEDAAALWQAPLSRIKPEKRNGIMLEPIASYPVIRPCQPDRRTP